MAGMPFQCLPSLMPCEASQCRSPRMNMPAATSNGGCKHAALCESGSRDSIPFISELRAQSSSFLQGFLLRFLQCCWMQESCSTQAKPTAVCSSHPSALEGHLPASRPSCCPQPQAACKARWIIMRMYLTCTEPEKPVAQAAQASSEKVEAKSQQKRTVYAF